MPEFRFILIPKHVRLSTGSETLSSLMGSPSEVIRLLSDKNVLEALLGGLTQTISSRYAHVQ